MKNLFLGISVFILIAFLAGCKKDSTLVRGLAIDKFTKKPIPDMFLQFDVVSGSGYFGTSIKKKYLAYTNSNGRFEFEVSEEDAGSAFFISTENPYFSGVPLTYVDTNSEGVKHMFDNTDYNNLFLNCGEEKVLGFLPSGIVSLHIQKSTFSNCNYDTIVVKSQNSELVVSFIEISEYSIYGLSDLYVEPSSMQKIKIFKIDNGERMFLKEMELYVPNYYLNKGKAHAEINL